MACSKTRLLKEAMISCLVIFPRSAIASLQAVQKALCLPAWLALQAWAPVTPHLANSVWARDTDI